MEEGMQSQEQGSESQGGESQDYRTQLPEDLRTPLEKFPDVEGLARGYIALEKDASRLRNAKGIIKPGENATSEQIKEYHTALGVPDGPDGYELSAPELPEGMIFNEERVKKFAELAHKNGIPKQAFEAIVSAYNEDQIAEYKEMQKAQQKFYDDAVVALKTDWGEDYEPNLSKADSVVDKVFGPEFKKLVKETGMGNHPDFVKGMYALSQSIGERSLPKPGAGKGNTTITWEKLVSMKMDPRYSEIGKRDPAYIKEVEAANREYAESLGAES